VDWKEVHVYLLRFIFVPATLYGYSNPSPKRKRLTQKMEGGQRPILRTVGLKNTSARYGPASFNQSLSISWFEREFIKTQRIWERHFFVFEFKGDY
jgi:hypothetical protein